MSTTTNLRSFVRRQSSLVRSVFRDLVASINAATKSSCRHHRYVHPTHARPLAPKHTLGVSRKRSPRNDQLTNSTPTDSSQPAKLGCGGVSESVSFCSGGVQVVLVRSVAPCLRRLPRRCSVVDAAVVVVPSPSKPRRREARRSATPPTKRTKSSFGTQPTNSTRRRSNQQINRSIDQSIDRSMNQN